MKQSKLFGKTSKTVASGFSAESHKLLIKGGFSIIKIIFSVSLVIAFVVIATNVIQSYTSGINIKNNNVKDDSSILKINNDRQELIKPIKDLTMTWDDNKNEIKLFKQDKEIIKIFSVGELDLELKFGVPYELSEDSLIYIADELLESPKNTFYFLVSATGMCGAQNCTWIIYQYNSEDDRLTALGNIFGAMIKLYLSPDYKKLATISYYHGGSCGGKSYIDIIDLSNLENMELEVSDNSYRSSYIDFLEWEDKEKIRFKMLYSDCGFENREDLEKIFEYDAGKNVLNSISTIFKEFPAGG